MRFLLLAVLCLFGSLPANATTYDVNINNGLYGVLTPTGQQAYAMGSSCLESGITCAGGLQHAYTFTANPGDTFDFGSVAIGAVIFGGGQMVPTQYTDSNGQLHFTSGYLDGVYPGGVGFANQYEPIVSVNSVNGGMPITFCNDGNPSCLSFLEAAQAAFVPVTVDLTYTVGSSGFIELGWIVGTYTPPAYIGAVPEPSTWAMMILGFIGIGAMTWRRRVITAASVRR